MRKANTAAMASAPVPAPTAATQNNTESEGGMVQRSMSRYRRRVGAQDAKHAPMPVPAIPRGMNPQGLLGQPDDKTATRLPAPRSPSPPPTPLSPQEEEARLRRAHERTQAQRLERQKADEEEAHRILAEQKRKDLERLEITLAAAVAAPSPVSPPPASGGKFKIFGRKKSAAKIKSTPPGSGGKSEAKVETRSTSDEMSGRGIEPAMVGLDAPVSAVNAGERVSFFTYDIRSDGHLLTYNSASSSASSKPPSTYP